MNKRKQKLLTQLVAAVGRIQNLSVWAGNQVALDRLIGAQEVLSGKSVGINASQVMAFFDDDDDDDDDDYTLSRDKPYKITGDGTAVLPVKGTLVNADIPRLIEDWFGIRGYVGLQRDFQGLAADDDVKRIVLDVDSGGGHVSGIYETSKALDKLRSVKPVASYTSDAMYSAAYWLGSNADMVGMSPMAGVGSIGVVMTHVEYTKLMENEGVKATVIRTGANKALGGPYETLSPEARSSLEHDMKFYHGKFVSQVSRNRKLSFEALQGGLTDGSTFLGNEGKRVGLADHVEDFDEFVARFEQTTGQVQTTSYQPQINHKTLSGGNPMDLQAALAKVQELEAEKAATVALVAEKESQLKVALVAQAALSEKVSVLEAQVAENTEYKDEHKNLMSASIKSMCTAMGTEALVPDNYEGVKALHAQVSEKFSAKFPGGQVSAPSQSDSPQANEEQDTESWYANLTRKLGDK